MRHAERQQSDPPTKDRRNLRTALVKENDCLLDAKADRHRTYRHQQNKNKRSNKGHLGPISLMSIA
jgi:hypothetical protein